MGAYACSFPFIYDPCFGSYSDLRIKPSQLPSAKLSAEA
jgi:hypothetical protein